MAATMDPAPAIPDAQMEADDIPFPCKGCGEILEEGKAFELAGNRWHIDCFRCHTCGTLLDSDAHLLLLGDGSLICQNCTYSCSACGNKIEDTAILTGDQAFCSNCFRCRNCKRRIENLRYARTSQGIFCMDCHETLMQRRRKKKAAAAAKKPAHLDKSLPSLPFEEPELPPVAHDPSKHHHGRDGVPDTTSRSHSPERRVPPPQPTHPAPSPPVRQPDNSADTMILPSTTYRPHRESDASNKSEPDALDEYLISVRYDGEDEATAQIAPADPNLLKNREQLSSFNHAPQRSPPPPPPHGPPQEGGRAPTDHDGIPQVAELPANEWRPHDKLQDRRAKEETPRSESRESGSRPSSPHVRSNVHPDSLKSSATPQKPAGTAPGSTSSSTRPSGDLHRLHEYGSTDSSRSLSSAPQYPRRGDSLEQSVTNHVLQKDSSEAHGVNKPQTAPSSGTRKEDATEPSKTSADVAQQSPRPTTSHARRGSTTTLHSDPGRDAGPTLSPLRYNATGGELSMDDDLARILGSDTSRDTKEGSGESFFKRMSNSVRHGRSFSDKASRMSKDAKSIKSSGAGLQDAFEDRDDVTWLKNELRKERQRSLEKDQKIAELEAALNAQAEVKQANSELKEKRSTMVVLDAKKEVVMRELAVLTEQLEKEKQGGGPMDLAKLTNSVVREFAERLNQLKESFAPEIEKLMKERSQMQEELEKLARMKDKSFSEFEQLSSKNAQLAELNNQLVHQIQELYKANSGLEGSRPNGLGIHSHSKEKSVGSVEVKTGDLASSGSSMAIHDEAEPATIVPGPQVVSIRKGQPRKFNWKRGGQNVAKGVTKGIKGAFSSERESSSTQNQNGNKEESGTSSTTQKSQTQDPGRGFSNLFGNQKRPAPWKSQQQQQQQQNGNSNSSAQTDNAEKPAEGLFGVDLEQRLEQEKSIIPAIVTRCIQEVELRGMDQEGIYRKSGASSVTQSIRDGFERANDFDISDPDLDIHAVTSALKQYFRKLPTPLITYEVYDKVLETNDIISHSSRVEAVRNSLEGLPKSHRDVLEFLVFHLKRVVEHEKENLMSSQNIAVVFAPTIMRPESIAREMTDVQRKNEALKFIVENCQEIFM